MIANIQPKQSKTFRTGLQGNWKHEFDEEVIREFKNVAGDWLIKLGYEKNLQW
ncbi:hypothetical protein ACFW1D_24095 [Priestia megaterium]|uniref:hypothetical protein n=1 Tax=Priestia megaterium TaxID=1404 RepID=UPI00366EADB1